MHGLRGRVDAILVGIGTALADDPLLTPRPEGPRRPLRIVLDSAARLPLDSRLVRTAAQSPVLVAVGPQADAARCAALGATGCDVWRGAGGSAVERLAELLAVLGGRRLTNLLVEGGAGVFRTAFAAGLVDETWGFLAPRLVGGDGLAILPDVPQVDVEAVDHPGGDILIRGLVRRPPAGSPQPSAGVTSPAGRGSGSASA